MLQSQAQRGAEKKGSCELELIVHFSEDTCLCSLCSFAIVMSLSSLLGIQLGFSATLNLVSERVRTLYLQLLIPSDC